MTLYFSIPLFQFFFLNFHQLKNGLQSNFMHLIVCKNKQIYVYFDICFESLFVSSQIIALNVCFQLKSFRRYALMCKKMHWKQCIASCLFDKYVHFYWFFSRFLLFSHTGTTTTAVKWMCAEKHLTQTNPW